MLYINIFKYIFITLYLMCISILEWERKGERRRVYFILLIYYKIEFKYYTY